MTQTAPAPPPRVGPYVVDRVQRRLSSIPIKPGAWAVFTLMDLDTVDEQRADEILQRAESMLNFDDRHLALVLEISGLKAPTERLWRLIAQPSVAAIGLAYDIPLHTAGHRLWRVVLLIDRDGTEVIAQRPGTENWTITRHDDGSPVAGGFAHSALRRALRLPSGPLEVDAADVLVRRWFNDIKHDLQRQPDLTWEAATALRPRRLEHATVHIDDPFERQMHQLTVWEDIRQDAIQGEWEPILDPAAARWMDAPLASRWLDVRLPAQEELLEQIGDLRPDIVDRLLA